MKTLFIIIFALLQLNGFCQDVLINKEAPGFKLTDLKGNEADLKDFVKKGPVLINFWATWCKPCIEEMAEYKELYEEYKGKGFTLLAVSTDNKKSENKVRSAAETRGYNFPILLDQNMEAAKKYNVAAIPLSVIVDKKGKITYVQTGYVKRNEKTVRTKIEELLKQGQ